MTGEPSFDQIQPSSLVDALKIDGNQFEDFIRSIGAKSLGLYIKICLPHVFIDYSTFSISIFHVFYLLIFRTTWLLPILEIKK